MMGMRGELLIPAESLGFGGGTVEQHHLMPQVCVARDGAAAAVFRVARMPAGDDHPELARRGADDPVAPGSNAAARGNPAAEVVPSEPAEPNRRRHEQAFAYRSAAREIWFLGKMDFWGAVRSLNWPVKVHSEWGKPVEWGIQGLLITLCAVAKWTMVTLNDVDSKRVRGISSRAIP